MGTPSYPLTLDLTGRRVVVVGGGPVAARRARGLVEAGAQVELIAPWVGEDVAAQAADGEIAWHEREFVAGDLVLPDPAWLVHTATGDPHVDAQVAAEADAARVWCVRADDRSEEHTSELQSRRDLVCRLLLEKKKTKNQKQYD